MKKIKCTKSYRILWALSWAWPPVPSVFSEVLIHLKCPDIKCKPPEGLHVCTHATTSWIKVQNILHPRRLLSSPFKTESFSPLPGSNYCSHLHHCSLIFPITGFRRNEMMQSVFFGLACFSHHYTWLSAEILEEAPWTSSSALISVGGHINTSPFDFALSLLEALEFSSSIKNVLKAER